MLATTNKNDIAMQKDIFRFSATLFSETTDVYSSLDSQLQMIKCIFAKANNAITFGITIKLLNISVNSQTKSEETIVPSIINANAKIV